MGARITGRKRAEVIRRFGTLCYICGIECVVYKGQLTGAQKPNALTIDHVLCRALGGTDDVDNLAVCCANCNNIKDDLPLGNEVGLELMRFRLHYGLNGALQ